MLEFASAEDPRSSTLAIDAAGDTSLAHQAGFWMLADANAELNADEVPAKAENAFEGLHWQIKLFESRTAKVQRNRTHGRYREI